VWHVPKPCCLAKHPPAGATRSALGSSPTPWTQAFQQLASRTNFTRVSSCRASCTSSTPCRTPLLPLPQTSGSSP
jgi:hypothetical protein